MRKGLVEQQPDRAGSATEAAPASRLPALRSEAVGRTRSIFSSFAQSRSEAASVDADIAIAVRVLQTATERLETLLQKGTYP